MNANPADCDCERCEIDRERAPYQLARLRALREATTAQVSAALDAVESGSHRDSPAANGALLVLTGLMLEQESKLSGAMVGRAARQEDQGEQSPMAAAEMERRIGLMGRLNDAAARRRPQPAPEVADHDAELSRAEQKRTTGMMRDGSDQTGDRADRGDRAEPTLTWV